MDQVVKYCKKYRDMGYTCAESTLMAANDAWGLDLDAKEFRILGGFAGGYGLGDTCGAVSGGVAALSYKYLEVNGHESPLMMAKVRLFVSMVDEMLGMRNCRDLGPVYRNLEENCTPTVWAIAEILDNVESLDMSDIPAHSDYDLRFPPPGKPNGREIVDMDKLKERFRAIYKGEYRKTKA